MVCVLSALVCVLPACRYMATSDLANELAKPTFRFDSATSEKQVSDVVLTQLEDAAGDISGLAVKWWVAPLGCLLLGAGAFGSAPALRRVLPCCALLHGWMGG